MLAAAQVRRPVRSFEVSVSHCTCVGGVVEPKESRSPNPYYTLHSSEVHYTLHCRLPLCSIGGNSGGGSGGGDGGGNSNVGNGSGSGTGDRGSGDSFATLYYPYYTILYYTRLD